MKNRMSIKPSLEEIRTPLPGDDILPDCDVVMDRAFTLSAPPDKVWPWFIQLGKGRAGWYFPRSLDRFFPKKGRALRRIDPALQRLKVGNIIPDWGGKDATLELRILKLEEALVYYSKRGTTEMSWAITMKAITPGSTRVLIRLRLKGIKRRKLAEYGGGSVDWLTIVALANGLEERLANY